MLQKWGHPAKVSMVKFRNHCRQKSKTEVFAIISLRLCTDHCLHVNWYIEGMCICPFPIFFLGPIDQFPFIRYF